MTAIAFMHVVIGVATPSKGEGKHWVSSSVCFSFIFGWWR